MQKTARRAEREARAAERDRKHAARTVQTVRTRTAYVPETHPLMHWDPDPSIPAHVPMDLVAQQIQKENNLKQKKPAKKCPVFPARFT